MTYDLAVPSQLQAWWTTGLADNPSYAQTLDPSLVESLRAKFAKAPDLRAGSVKLKIENVELETHDVVVAPNQRAAKPCVVFRVSHEPQKPVFIQLRTQKPYALGEEHRYYPEANRYTAIFWNLPDPQNPVGAKGIGEPPVVEIVQEPGLVDRLQRPQSHRHRRELPEIRHEPRVRVGRDPLAVDFLAEHVELGLGEPPVEIGARVDAR